MRRLVPALAALAVLLAPPAALAATVEADTSDYPVIRAIFVSESPSVLAPEVTENGQPVADLVATNLGRAKSIALLIDRSQSMAGKPLADAVDAARAFVAAKPPEDRIAVATFATQPSVLTSFQASTTDADSALRTIEVDPVRGTTLYDAVAVAANSLASETYLGRVVIVVTDGNETRSKATLEDAIAAAHNAGASVYVVAIESRLFDPEPLQQLAEKSGGNYYPAASSEALDDVYASIAEELSRTWRLEYVTAALPSEKVDLVAKTGSETASARLVAPGGPIVTRTPAVGGRLPEQFFGSAWGQAAFALVVGLLVLLGCGFLFAAPKGAWLRGRLDPHLATPRRAVKESGGRERVQFAASLFHATEATLGKFKPWKQLSRMLERADLPLRTPEFVYVIVGAGLLGSLVTAAFTRSAPFILAGLAVGFVP